MKYLIKSKNYKRKNKKKKKDFQISGQIKQNTKPHVSCKQTIAHVQLHEK